MYASARSNGPIDFKNRFAGRANDELLGNAGNFSYYAIGSDLLPDLILDLGAAGYGIKQATLRSLGVRVKGPDFSDLTGNFFSDRSAKGMRESGLAAHGCNR
jgi:hypothetical protein